LCDFGGSDIKRGEKADGVGSGRRNEQSFFQEDVTEVDGESFSIGDFQGTGVETEAEEEAVTADFGDRGVLPAGDGFADLFFALLGVGGEIFRNDRFDDRLGGRAGEGVAAVGRAVAAGAEEIGVFFGDPESSDGEAAAHALGPRNGIGDEAGGDGVVSVEVAGAAEAGLHFVEEEKEIIFPGEGGESFEECAGHGIDSAFALDGFEKEGDGLIGEGGFDGVEIVGIDVNESGEEGVEALVDFSLGGGGHRADGAAVKRLVEGDDFVTTGGLSETPREFNKPVVGFGAGVGEEDFAGMGHDFLHDEFGEVGLVGDMIEV